MRLLISWVQAGEWTEIAGNFELGEAEDLLPCPVPCSADTFVLRVRGESMEPKFHDGELIFVDPQVAPVSGRHVRGSLNYSTLSPTHARSLPTTTTCAIVKKTNSLPVSYRRPKIGVSWDSNQ